MRVSPEFPVSQSEGIYGYSIIDIGLGKLKRFGYSGLKWTGITLAVAATGTFLADTVITGNAADSQGLRRSSPERIAFINSYRGLRSSAELAGIALGTGLAAGASTLQARRNAMRG